MIQKMLFVRIGGTGNGIESAGNGHAKKVIVIVVAFVPVLIILIAQVASGNVVACARDLHAACPQPFPEPTR